MGGGLSHRRAMSKSAPSALHVRPIGVVPDPISVPCHDVGLKRHPLPSGGDGERQGKADGWTGGRVDRQTGVDERSSG